MKNGTASVYAKYYFSDLQYFASSLNIPGVRRHLLCQRCNAIPVIGPFGVGQMPFLVSPRLKMRSKLPLKNALRVQRAPFIYSAFGGELI